jgi:hypothetical protein
VVEIHLTKSILVNEKVEIRPLSMALSGTSIMCAIRYILTTGIAVVSMFFSTFTLGEDIDNNLPNLGNEESYYWRQINNQMSPQEYRDASKHNQHVATKVARSYLEEQIKSLGVPIKEAAVAGAAINFAVDGGTFNLNESKTLALEFKDPIASGRGMFLKFKVDW